MGSEETCSRCLKPLESKSGGIVTHFIDVCRCNLKLEDASGPAVEICQTCKKPVGSRRKGTLSQFVFGPGQCSCGKPESEYRFVSDYRQPVFEGFTEEKDTQLELDEDRFPVERYTPLLEIGRGASGSVYLCKDNVLSKRVALKVLRKLTNKQLVAFQEEARGTSKLEHANIVTVLDFGATQAGVPYMVMEYIEGISLKEYLQEHGPFDAKIATLVVSRLCKALAYAHEHEVYHRDIKPGNILLYGLDDDPGVCLIDFGVARIKEETGSGTRYQGRTLAGTTAYMTPDTVRGLEYNAASEVYSVGCVMFEMLTGSPPFKGATALETVAMHANQAAPILAEQGDYPTHLSSAVARCLAKEPSARYPDMQSLEADLTSKPDTARHTQPDAKAHPSRSGVKLKAIAVLCLGGLLVVTAILVVYNNLPSINQSKDSRRYFSKPVEEPPVFGTLGGVQVEDFRAMIPAGEPSFEKSEKKGRVECRFCKDSDLRQATITYPKVRRWRLYDCHFSGATLANLKELGVEHLEFRRCPLTDEAFHYISTLDSLVALSIESCETVSSTNLAKLNRLPRLGSFTLINTPIDGDIATELTRFKALMELKLDIGMLRQSDVQKLDGIAYLKGLNLTHCQSLDVSSLDFLADKQLQHFTMEDAHISDKAVGLICKFTELKYLRLRNCTIADDQREVIRKALPKCDLKIWKASPTILID